MRGVPRVGETTLGTLHEDRYEYTAGDIAKAWGSYYKLKSIAYDGCRGWTHIIDLLVDYERARKKLRINPRKMTDIDCQNIAKYLNGGKNE